MRYSNKNNNDNNESPLTAATWNANGEDEKNQATAAVCSTL